MTWAWSHSDAAYSNARQHLWELEIGTLRIIFAEWKACQSFENASGSIAWNTQYEQACLHSLHLPQNTLVDYIWDRMEELRTSDNGGFNAWACPYGCHTVPFS